MEFSSRPHAVTVFREGALVERRVTIDTPRSGRVVLPGLPLSLDDRSIAVQAHGPARVGSATVRLHARPRSDAPEAPSHGELRETREALTRAERRQEQLQAELELLTSIPMPSRPRPVPGQPPPPSPLTARLAFDAFVDGETRERQEALATLTTEIDQLRRAVADLRDRIRRQQGARAARPDELTKSVHLDLHAEEGAGPVELRVRYRVPACRWVPRYALRLRGDEATLQLRAAIAQASGEDWSAVELTLSTAEPQAYSPLPRLASARIGKEQPTPPGRPPRPPPEGAVALFEDVDRALRSLPRAALPPKRSPGATSLLAVREVYEEAASEVAEEPRAPAMMGAFGGAVAGAAADMEMDDRMPAPPPMAEPAPAFAAPPAPKAARAWKKKGMAPTGAHRRDALMEEAEAEEEPTEPMEAPASAWPDYGTLALPDPIGAGRGRLAPVSTEQKLVAVLRDAGMELPFDVPALLVEHQRRALAVARLSLPGGALAVRPSHFDHAVRSTHPVDVPSLGSWHTVSLGEHTAACSVRYIGVPREEASMYRIATMANPCGHPLLAGPVEVYVDGTYVLTATLPTTGSGEDVELGVGVEPSLHVARNTRFEEKRSDERVVAMRELHHHITIELRNDLGKAVDVEVRERVPVPDGEAEVAIDVIAAEPAWADYDQKERGAKLKGGHRWRLTIEPRSRQTLEAHYVLRLYANNEVVGGDRREA